MANDRHFEFVEKYFKWQHLRSDLQPISHRFRETADFMIASCHTDDAELS